MLRSNGRLEEISRDRLVRVLIATAKKENANLTARQCGAIANRICEGKQTEFCGRLFEARV